MKKTIIYLFLGIAALVVAACSTKNDPYHLRIAYSPALCQAPLHIAVEKGFFEAEGIKPENVQFDAAHVQEALRAVCCPSAVMPIRSVPLVFWV